MKKKEISKGDILKSGNGTFYIVHNTIGSEACVTAIYKNGEVSLDIQGTPMQDWVTIDESFTKVLSA